MFAALDFIQGGLSDVDVSPLHQLRHLAVKKGEQQGADMGAVDISIRHDDHPVVAKLLRVKFFGADSTAQGRDQRPHFR